MLDWDDLRYFLAIARAQNLSAAAKVLHVAQSTVGRRLATLEASLGVRLLNRTPDGYVITSAGEEVFAKAERLEAEALLLERQVSGRDTHLAGLVRVTCAEGIASHVLAPALAGLGRKFPDIVVELIPDARELSLSMREADISVRLTRSNQHDLVVRRIGTIGFGLYASRDYLKACPNLNFDGGCSGQYLVRQIDDIENLEQTGWLAAVASHAHVSFRTSSHEAAVAATLHGGGLGCLACFRADREEGLVRIVTPTLVPDAPIWLVTHKDNRRNARIKAILNHISESVRGFSDVLQPKNVSGLLYTAPEDNNIGQSSIE